MIEAEPVAPPAVDGEKEIPIVLLEPARTVNGVDVVPAKPLPVTLIAETTTSTVPVFDKVMFCELLVPTETFPNDKDAGEALKLFAEALVAVPVKDTTVGELLKLLTTDTEPVALPAD